MSGTVPEELPPQYLYLERLSHLDAERKKQRLLYNVTIRSTKIAAR